MTKNQIHAAAITITFVSTMALATPALAVDDLLQDSGSWGQIVGESSLKFIDPKLAKARIWLEGQVRVNDDFGHFYQGMVRTALGYSLSDRATL